MSLQAMLAAIEMADLAPNEKLLLIVLGSYSDQAWECWPSVKRLSANTGMSPRTVTGTLSRLEERGLLRRDERWRKDGSRMSNLIKLLFAPPANSAWGDDVEAAPSVRARRTPPANPAGHETSIAKTEENQGSSARGSRLPEGWEPEPNIAMIIGLTDVEAADQLERFRDYWTAQPGARGRKSDWTATWRNWCRTALERTNGRGSPATRYPASPDRGADIATTRREALVDGARQALDRRRRWTLGS